MRRTQVCGLKETGIQLGLGILYPRLSRYAHSNDDDIVLKRLFYPENGHTGLVVLIRVQGKWQDPLT